MAKFPTIGGFSAVSHEQSGNETSINCFPEKHDGKTEWRLRNSPGLKPFMPVGEEPIRGMREVEGRAFVVEGTRLYEVFSTRLKTLRGTLINAITTPVVIDDNGLELILTDGINGYVLNLGTNDFVVITDEDWYPSKTLAVVDGYAVFARDGTGQYFHSDLYIATTYLASDFASAETNPDRLIGVANDPVGLLGLGSQSLEIYWNSGDAEQVFQRRGGAKMNIGCVAPYSIVTMDNGTFWIGADAEGVGGVWRFKSGNVEKVSNIALDEVIQANLATIADATAFGYRQAGHVYYCLNIPGADSTYVFDPTVANPGAWHERKSFNGAAWGRWWGQFHMAAFGRNIVGDYRSGDLYELDLSYFFDGADTLIRRERTMRPMFDDEDYELVRYEGLSLDMVVGVGLANPPYNDPHVELHISKDGGKSYPTVRRKPIGKIGEYKKRLNFRRLSISRNVSFRLVYAFPTEFIVSGAYINARK